MAIPRNLANLAPKLSATGGSFATTIGVGGATPAASGSGISFPATQSASSDANTLDDYEEGTFTPDLKFGGNAVSLTYGSRGGRYTKIGRCVTVSFYFVLSNKGSSSGVATVSLPFHPMNMDNLINQGIRVVWLLTVA